jgi:type IV secretion system protein VirB8
MSGKKFSSPQIENAISKAVNFEITVADMARRSERRAWLVASGAIALALVLAAGYFYMLPLKERVPYLIMADAYTGTSSIARLVEDADHNSITTKEAVNRSNVAHFLLARESYDVALMNLHDRTTVYTMSSPAMATAYTNLHSLKSADSPLNVYGKNKAIRVKILSISLIGGSARTWPKGATVRFQRSLYDKQSGTAKPLDSNIATMEFTYKSNLKMEEKYRIEVIVQGAGRAVYHFNTQLQQVAADAKSSAETMQEQQKIVARAQSMLVWKGLIALTIGSLLAAGGSSYLVWKNAQELRQAEFDVDILHATRSGSLTRCGEHNSLCVRVGKSPKRTGAQGEYLMLED